MTAKITPKTVFDDMKLLQRNCPHSIVWCAERDDTWIVGASLSRHTPEALYVAGWSVFIRDEVDRAAP